VKIIKQKKAKIRLLSKKPPKSLLRINHKRHKNEKRLNFQVNLLLGRKRNTLFGTRCHGARIETSHRPRPSVPQNTLITKKGLLFQVNLFFGRKRNTLLWGSNRNVAPSTTLGTTKRKKAYFFK
jgi:hypothetical protein